jgi:hypothetical protein
MSEEHGRVVGQLHFALASDWLIIGRGGTDWQILEHLVPRGCLRNLWHRRVGSGGGYLNERPLDPASQGPLDRHTRDLSSNRLASYLRRGGQEPSRD